MNRRRLRTWMGLSLGLLAAASLGAGRSTRPPDIPAHAGTPVRVACVGDSLSTGFLMKNAGRDAYPAQLARMLGTNWTVRTFANPGRTALKNTAFSFWNEAAFKQALAFQPEAVILCFGTNDADPSFWNKGKQNFTNDYRALAAAFAGLPSKPRIWLCLPPPLFLPAGDIRCRTLSDEVIPAIRRIAAQDGYGLIDWHAALAGQSAVFMADGVHPLPAGAELMAEAACDALLGKEPADATPPDR